MKIRYEISSHTQMVLDNKKILDELSKQRWALSFERELGTYNFFLTVEIEHLPRVQSGGMDPLYGLLDIVAKPTNKLRLKINADKEPVTLLNIDEVLAKWMVCKKEILDTYGSDDNNLNMVKNLEESFQVYLQEVKGSFFYHILLSQWKVKKKWNFKTGSTTCVGDSVDLTIKRTDKIKNEEDQIVWELLGEGYLDQLSKSEKKYNEQLKKYAHANFNYHYKLKTTYVAGKGLPGIDLFRIATTRIEEQSSEGYKYYNTIEFNRIEE